MATSVQDFNKANPTYVGNVGRYVQPTKSKKGSGNKSWLSSIISELGGAGGAWGGAAAGAAAGSVVPGIGNIVGGVLGAGIGGLAGAFGGKAAENKIRDNQNLFGAGGSAESAWKEGALSGALGAAGTGVTALRGVKAAGGLKNVKALTGGGDDFAKATQGLVSGGKKAGASMADDGLRGGGRLANGATRLESRALGFAPGDIVDGRQLTFKDTEKLLKIMKNENIKTGMPDNVARQVTSKLDKVGSNIDDALLNANRPLTKTEQNFLKSSFAREIGENYALSAQPGALRIAKTLEGKLGKVSSLDDVVKQRRLIQTLIKDSRSSGSAIPGAENVYRVARKHLNDLASTISPELKALNSSYSGLSQLETATLGAAKGLNAQSRSAMAGVVGGLKAGDTATALKATTGNAGRRLSETLSNTAGSGSMINRLGKGVAVRGIANTMTASPTEELPEEDTALYDSAYDQGLSGAIDGAYGPPEQAAYTIQQALAEAYQMFPNASESELLSVAKSLQKDQELAGGGGPNVTKVTAQQYSLAQRGQQSLQQMAQLLQDNPSVLNRTATPGRKLPIVGGFISNAAGTGDFDAIGYNIASSLLRIETGAQANESEIKNLQSQMIPRAGDSEETVARKMQQLNQAFSVITNAANNNYSSDLSSLIQQGGY